MAIMSPHGALRAYTVLLTAEPLRGSPMTRLLQYRHSLHISDVRVERVAIMSPHGALRAYTVLLTVEPLRGSPMTRLLQYRYSLHISDVRVGRGYLVTAWRTSCLYGVTYSRASSRLPDVAPSSVPDTVRQV